MKTLLLFLLSAAAVAAGERVVCINKTEYPLQFRFRETGAGRPASALDYYHVVVPPYSSGSGELSATPGATVTISAFSLESGLYAGSVVGGWAPDSHVLARTVYVFAGYDSVTGLPLVTHEVRRDGTGYEALQVFLAGLFTGCLFELFGLILRIVKTVRAGTGMEV